ncbi:GIN domain-containing protein [Persicobacter psychrovividus]|uniref:Putative auto-transporter adhesin head GIN domain-containing protein n=1 Tax=Persicobacter psychrovividus TaxID=387638 RepID=A0ABM7VB29_9BACT|nr:hypothetical protein PEPS_04060 [Persicobacter psychrovividus]
MKKISNPLFLCLIVLSAIFSSCSDSPAPSPSSLEVPLGNFTSVEIGQHLHLNIQNASESKAQVSGFGELSNLHFKINDNHLSIYLAEGAAIDQLQITLSAKMIHELIVTNEAKVDFSKTYFSFEPMTITAKDSAKVFAAENVAVPKLIIDCTQTSNTDVKNNAIINLPTVIGQEAEIKLADRAVCNLSGNSFNTISVEAKGASKFCHEPVEGASLNVPVEAEKYEVKLIDAANAWVNASSLIKGEADGGAHLFYKADGHDHLTVDVEVNGGAELSKRES